MEGETLPENVSKLISEKQVDSKLLDNSEELLLEDDNRFVLFPIKYHAIYNMYKTAEAAIWNVSDINLSQDSIDWDKLTINEQEFITSILAFFAASDGIVNENLALRFYNEIKIQEVRSFYGVQIMMENVHNETYSFLIDVLIKNQQKKYRAFHALDHFPCIRKKAEWALKWIKDSSSNFQTRLIAFAIVEGIFFSGAFASIYWLKTRNLMPGLCKSNEYIARDEGLHTEFAILLYSEIQHKLPKEKISEMFLEAVGIEKEFIIEAIPCRMLGMNSDDMIQYIEFVSDRLLMQLGYQSIWHSRNPFTFMERIGLEQKTNFFENQPTEYSRCNVGNRNDSAKDIYTFSKDTDF